MTYFVRVRARNFWGWSEYSDLLEIKASTWPSKVNTPLTVLDESSGDILLQWSEPDNKSDTITEYRIECLNYAGVWSEVCDGSSAPTSCLVEMEKLQLEYNLPF